MLKALRCLHQLVLFWFLGWSHEVGKWKARNRRIEATCRSQLIPPGYAWWWSNLWDNQLRSQTAKDFLCHGFLETAKPQLWPRFLLRSPRWQRDSAGAWSKHRCSDGWMPLDVFCLFLQETKWKMSERHMDCQEFNLIAISYWLFIGDVGSLIGSGDLSPATGHHSWLDVGWLVRSSLISYLHDWLVTWQVSVSLWTRKFGARRLPWNFVKLLPEGYVQC